MTSFPTKKLTLVSTDHRPYRVEFPTPTESRPSSFLFAFVKSGSTLMNNMVRDYCNQIDAPYFSLYDQAFAQGIRTADIDHDAEACFHSRGVVYSGFRHYPAFRLPTDGARQALLARDPRDMLVSLYFSLAKSHVIPAGNTSLEQQRRGLKDYPIEAFAVQRANGFVQTFRDYREKLPLDRCRIFRYEDVIYRKEEWLSELVEYCGLPVDASAIARIARQHDIVPASENESDHIRRVHPGDYRNKLSASVIARLNSTLTEFLEEFDYPSD